MTSLGRVFNDIPMSSKALLVPIVILVLMTVTLVPTFLIEARIEARLDAHIDRTTPQFSQGKEAVGLMLEARLSAYEHVRLGVDEAAPQYIQLSWAVTRGKADRAVATLREWIDAQEHRLGSDIVGDLHSTTTAFEQLVANMLWSTSKDPGVGMFYMGNMDRLSGKLRDKLNAANLTVQARLSEERAHYRQQATDVRLAGLGLTVLTIILVGALNRLFMVGLARPLVQLTGAMTDVAEGRTDVRLPQFKRKDELGKIAAVAERFRGTMVEAATLAAAKTEAERDMALNTAALLHERDVARRQREFVSIFSHELQTPMTVIDGVAHQLVRNAEKVGDDSARDKLKRIRAAVTRVSGLVESTLSAARVEEGSIRFSPTRMDLRGLIQDEVRTQEGLATQQHRFDLDLDALPENVSGDCGLLAQVFSNLISNAIKYSPEGGTVGIKAIQREGSVQIAVSDEGVGIPTAEISRISERYFRASSAGDIKGTGLGLNLVRHIVELHGWRLQIDSALKEGSTFSIVLPLADDAYSEVA